MVSVTFEVSDEDVAAVMVRSGPNFLIEGNVDRELLLGRKSLTLTGPGRNIILGIAP